MSKDLSLNTSNIKGSLGLLAAKLKPYRVVFAILVVALIYGLLLMRISNLNNIQPSEGDVAAQTNPSIGTQIDEDAVRQLKQLRDNNVSVQTLFEQERQNPFQE